MEPSPCGAGPHGLNECCRMTTAKAAQRQQIGKKAEGLEILAGAVQQSQGVGRFAHATRFAFPSARCDGRLGKPCGTHRAAGRSWKSRPCLVKVGRLKRQVHAGADGLQHGLRRDAQLAFADSEGVAVDRDSAPGGGADGETGVPDGELGIFPFGSDAVAPLRKLATDLRGKGSPRFQCNK